MGYRAPLGEILFAMKRIADPGDAVLAGVPVEEILGEAGKFAEQELAPLNRVGDREGVRLAAGQVTTAAGWKDAYRSFAEAGWLALSAPEEFGGQGLPVLLQVAVEEIWNGSNAAFAVGPMLTVGAIKMLAAHAGPEIQARFLPAMISGAWTGTMNLTEPQAGSDLGAIRTRAERTGDGAYAISGQKVFITYGDHDLTDNIVHLVLARLPDAPPGTAGISLFVVPKLLVGEDGRPGERNRVTPAGVEKKLGLHGAPTCTMIFDGATGFIVGGENRGLAAMFTMMNLARLSVGVQGVGVAERAYQEALAYARDRRQGRASGDAAGAVSPIVKHPDVQAMLLRMKALIAASRALTFATAHAIDMSGRGPAEERAAWADRASLLTPVAKAFPTDAAIEVASLGIQVHGGAGYIEETGAAQHLRDARVFAIYEGTNGIQAIDLVTRKLTLGDGAAFRNLADESAAIVADVGRANREDFGQMGAILGAAIGDLRAATDYVLSAFGEGRRDDGLAVATPYLRLFALAIGGALLARGALAADGSEVAEVAIARYFAETIAVESSALRATVVNGGGALRQAAATWLAQPAAGGQ